MKIKFKPDCPSPKCNNCIAQGKNAEAYPPPKFGEPCYMCGHECDEPNCPCAGINGWMEYILPQEETILEDRIHKESGKIHGSSPVMGTTGLTNEIDRLTKQNQKLQGQVERRGKHLSQLQSKLYQWNEAIIEGAKIAGYSLKWDDPDHDAYTGWPPGCYPSHVEKLLQHVLDTKNGVINGLLADRACQAGRIEVQENEITSLGKHLIGLTRALQEVREALEIGPVGDVVAAAQEARKAQLREIKEKGNFEVEVKRVEPGVYSKEIDMPLNPYPFCSNCNDTGDGGAVGECPNCEPCPLCLKYREKEVPHLCPRCRNRGRVLREAPTVTEAMDEWAFHGGVEPGVPDAPKPPDWAVSHLVREKKREKLTLLIQRLVVHEGKCWKREGVEGGAIVKMGVICDTCTKALEAWEPCPYCLGRKKEGCFKCINYPVPGWREV